MAQRRTDAKIKKQLETVEQQLSGKAKGNRRLDLLRKQAELGDARDDAVVKARRAAARDDGNQG